MKKIIFMRGVPNTGKSYWASRLAGYTVLSTDDYFLNHNPGHTQPGGYVENWSPAKLAEAHAWNQRRASQLMTRGHPQLVIDNTNLRLAHVLPYAQVAIGHGYQMRILESRSPWWLEIRPLLQDRQANRSLLEDWAVKLAGGFTYKGQIVNNGHGVPAATILNMLLTLEDYTVQDILRAVALINATKTQES